MVLRLLIIWLCLSLPVMAAEIVLDDTTEVRDVYLKMGGTCAIDCKWHNISEGNFNTVGITSSTLQGRTIIGFNISTLPAVCDSARLIFTVYDVADASKTQQFAFYLLNHDPDSLLEGYYWQTDNPPGATAGTDNDPAMTWRWLYYNSPIYGNADSTFWKNVDHGNYYCGGSDVYAGSVDKVDVANTGQYDVSLGAAINDIFNDGDTLAWFLVVDTAHINSLAAPDGNYAKYWYASELYTAGGVWLDSIPKLTIYYPDQANRRRALLLRENQ